MRLRRAAAAAPRRLLLSEWGTGTEFTLHSIHLCSFRRYGYLVLTGLLLCIKTLVLIL